MVGEIKKCAWCDDEFITSRDGQECCSSEHQSKYNDSLANDGVEKPGDKYGNDGISEKVLY